MAACGRDRAAGAIAGARTVSNPIRAAELVLASPQVLMIGEAVDQLARAHGLAEEPNEAFVTRRERARLALGPSEAPGAHGTVGAVCLDRDGGLAAATSTGGLSGQPAGRVGDSPVFGAGTWADERVAVSCTGDGEAFIRAAAASLLTSRLAAGVDLDAAAAQALAEVGRLGGSGGLIALAANGQAATALSAEAMPRAIWRAGEEPRVEIE
jgi:isoaspartyl peptidase/L-asparaginase-like protein (Ntn-hydrolase superfamily)